MSAYTSQSQIGAYISEQNLVSLTDDNGTGQVDPVVLASVIAGASSDCDAALCATYAVPFSPIPSIVAQAATVFACEALMGRRLVPNESNPFTSQANSWRSTLKTICQKRAGLDAATVSAVPAGMVEVTRSLVNSSTA